MSNSFNSSSRPGTAPSNAMRRPPTSPGRPLTPIGHGDITTPNNSSYLTTNKSTISYGNANNSTTFTNQESLSELRDKIRRHHKFGGVSDDMDTSSINNNNNNSTGFVGNYSTTTTSPKSTNNNNNKSTLSPHRGGEGYSAMWGGGYGGGSRVYQDDISLRSLLASNQKRHGKAPLSSSSQHRVSATNPEAEEVVDTTIKLRPPPAGNYSAFSIGGASNGRIDTTTNVSIRRPQSAGGILHPTSATAARMSHIRDGLYEYGPYSPPPSTRPQSAMAGGGERKMNACDKYLAMHHHTSINDTSSYNYRRPQTQQPQQQDDPSWTSTLLPPNLSNCNSENINTTAATVVEAPQDDSVAAVATVEDSTSSACTLGLLGEIEEQQRINRRRQTERYRLQNIEKWADVALNVMDAQLTPSITTTTIGQQQHKRPPSEVLSTVHAYLNTILEDLAGPFPTRGDGSTSTADISLNAIPLDHSDPLFRFKVFEYTLKRKLGILTDSEMGQYDDDVSAVAPPATTNTNDRSASESSEAPHDDELLPMQGNDPTTNNSHHNSNNPANSSPPPPSRLSATKKYTYVIMSEYNHYIRYLSEGNSLSAATITREALASTSDELLKTQRKLAESEKQNAAVRLELESTKEQLEEEKVAREAVDGFCDELKVTLAAYANEALPTEALARIVSASSPNRNSLGSSAAMSPSSTTTRPYVEAVRAFSAEVAQLRLHNTQLVEESNEVLDTLAHREKELAASQERLLQSELKVAQLKASLMAIRGYCGTLESNVNKLWSRERVAVENTNMSTLRGAQLIAVGGITSSENDLLSSGVGGSSDSGVGSLLLLHRAGTVPVGGAALPMTYSGIVSTSTPEALLTRFYQPPPMSQRHLKNAIVELLTEYVTTIQNSIYAAQPPSSRVSTVERILLCGAPVAVERHIASPSTVASEGGADPKWVPLTEQAEEVTRDLAQISAKVTTSLTSYTRVFGKRKNRLSTDSAAAHQAQTYLQCCIYYAQIAPSHTNGAEPLLGGSQLAGIKSLRGPISNADLSFFIGMYNKEIPTEAWHESCNRVIAIKHALTAAAGAHAVAGGTAGAKGKAADRLPRSTFLNIVARYFPNITPSMLDSLAAFSVMLQQNALQQPQVAGLGEGTIPSAVVLKSCLATDDITVDAFFDRVNPDYDGSGPLSTSTSAATNSFFKGEMAATEELCCGRPPLALMADYLLMEVALKCGAAHTTQAVAVAIAQEVSSQASHYLTSSSSVHQQPVGSTPGRSPRQLEMKPLRSHFFTDRLTTASLYDVGRILWNASGMDINNNRSSSNASNTTMTLFRKRFALLMFSAVVIDPEVEEEYNTALEKYLEHMEAVAASMEAVDSRGRRLPPMVQTIMEPVLPIRRVFKEEDLEGVIDRLLQESNNGATTTSSQQGDTIQSATISPSVTSITPTRTGSPTASRNGGVDTFPSQTLSTPQQHTLRVDPNVVVANAKEHLFILPPIIRRN